MTRYSLASIALLALVVSCSAGAAEDTAGQVTVWSSHADYRGRQVTLGPTGARGWVRDFT